MMTAGWLYFGSIVAALAVNWAWLWSKYERPGWRAYTLAAVFSTVWIVELVIVALLFAYTRHDAGTLDNARLIQHLRQGGAK